MKSTLFLRIASILTLLHALLHTVGGVFGKPLPGAAATAMAAMRANHFLVTGLDRTYADFYRGMGLAVSIFLLAETVVFWQLASLAKTDSKALRPILGTFLVAYLAMAVNSGAYFFSAPVITEVLIALSLGLAFVAAKPIKNDA